MCFTYEQTFLEVCSLGEGYNQLKKKQINLAVLLGMK